MKTDMWETVSLKPCRWFAYLYSSALSMYRKVYGPTAFVAYCTICRIFNVHDFFVSSSYYRYYRLKTELIERACRR